MLLNKQPLLLVLISFIIGILVQEYCSFSWQGIMVCLGLGFLFLLGFLVRNTLAFRLRPLFLVVFFVGVGVWSHFLNGKPSDLPNIPNNTDVIFSLNHQLNTNDKNRKYVVDIFLNAQKVRCLLYLPKTEQSLDFQHFYKAKLWIQEGTFSKNDYQFDYKKYLQRKGIYFQAYLSGDFQKVEKIELSFWEIIRQIRLNVLGNIEQSTLSKEVKSFLKSIILADRTELDEKLVLDFQQSGLIHLLSISGTHIGVIFGAIFWLFVNIFPMKFRKIAILMSLLSVWLFALFIGGGSPVIRACVMLTAYFGFQILQRKTNMLHALALAGFILLAMDTNRLFDVGFQLSFSAVLGIFWFNKPFTKYFPTPKKMISKIILYTFTLSISAQLGTMPFILYYFHQYSLVTIIANVLIVPFAQIYIIVSFIMTFIIGLNLNIEGLEWFYNESVILLLYGIKFFGSQDWALFSFIPFSISEVIVAMIGLYTLRNFIIKSNFTNLFRFLSIVLIFITLNLGLNIYEYQKSEVVVHYFFKEKIISVKEKDRVYFYIKEKLKTSKIEQYVIKPYCISRRTKHWEVIKVPEKTSKVKINNKLYEL